jgi:thiaminase
MTTPSLITKLGLNHDWEEATHGSPFIRALASGTLPQDVFDLWLIQVESFKMRS